MDVCGPFKQLTLGGNKYVLSMTTSPHRYVEVKGIKNRFEVAQYIFCYISWIERNLGKKVTPVHIDNPK